jgi:hypothetical protein
MKSMSNVSVLAASWNRFITRGFGITSDLLGSSHRFQFKNYQVSVLLPEQANFEVQEYDQAVVYSWQEQDGKRMPVGIAVKSVDVKVQLVEDVSIPESMLQVPLNAYDLVSEEHQTRLNNLCYMYEDIAKEAFDLWIRILRWKTNNGSIGRPEVVGSSSGWGTYLLDLEKEKPCWVSHGILTLPGIARIDITTWDEVQATLLSGLEPPVFYELIFDAVEHMKIGDFQRAVIDTAVGCEAFIRQLVSGRLPQELAESPRKYIQVAPIRRLLDEFLPEVLNDGQLMVLKENLPDLRRLFEARNIILHSGRKENLTAEECNGFLKAARALVSM